MKNLKAYINEIDATLLIPVTTMEDTDMSPMKIIAEQNDGDEALWNTTQDRWSRRAKHPMNLCLKSTIKESSWEIGDRAMYQGKEVEVVIPSGPNSTVGVIVEGRKRMVLESKLTRIDEFVMGGIQSLDPLNRMMQLAGLSVPSVTEPHADTMSETENTEEQILAEDDATNMFDQLFKSNFSGQYRNNPAAARLATVGQILAGLGTQAQDLKGQISDDMANKINASIGLGAALIQAANAMLQPNATMPPTSAE